MPIRITKFREQKILQSAICETVYDWIDIESLKQLDDESENQAWRIRKLRQSLRTERNLLKGLWNVKPSSVNTWNNRKDFNAKKIAVE